jgi:hypothetical protein
MPIKPFVLTKQVEIHLPAVSFKWRRNTVQLRISFRSNGSHDGETWYDTDIDVLLDGQRVNTSLEYNDEPWHAICHACVYFGMLTYEPPQPAFFKELERYLIEHLKLRAAVRKYNATSAPPGVKRKLVSL